MINISLITFQKVYRNFVFGFKGWLGNINCELKRFVDVEAKRFSVSRCKILPLKRMQGLRSKFGNPSRRPVNFAIYQKNFLNWDGSVWYVVKVASLFLYFIIVQHTVVFILLVMVTFKQLKIGCDTI